MISPSEIKRKAERKYPAFLSSLISNGNLFPLLITGDKNPGKNFAAFQVQLQALLLKSKEYKGYGYTITYKRVKTKSYGEQDIPELIYFEDKGDYVRFLSKEKETLAFQRDVSEILSNFPALQDWASRNVLKIVQYAGHWDSLLKVCKYFQQCPRPGLYIRELPIAVHTKFIEKHQSVLQELLDILISADINIAEQQFEKRFSLKVAEPLIRFKLLDAAMAAHFFSGLDDISIPVSGFMNLLLPVKRVIIVENKISLYTTLTLPKMSHTLAIFGSGYRLGLLKHVHWLNQVDIFYWGDIDAQGFEILSQIRGYFSHVQSRLMDKVTFEKFFEGDSGTPTRVESALNLTVAELELYHKLKQNNWRLEQEKIPCGYVRDYLIYG